MLLISAEFTAGDNNTGSHIKFHEIYIDRCETNSKFATLVSTMPAVNLPLVSLTLVVNNDKIFPTSFTLN